jgi:hypothetical protein
MKMKRKKKEAKSEEEQAAKQRRSCLEQRNRDKKKPHYSTPDFRLSELWVSLYFVSALFLSFSI